MMEYAVTDGRNPEFLRLCDRLDDEYYELFGDVALQYKEFNAIKVPHVVVLAIDDGTAIGCGSYKNFSQDSVEIKRVFVEKSYRKRGIATKIIEILENEAVRQNYRFAVLETGKLNVAGLRTYKKLGYEIIENFGFLEEDELCVCMKKDLGSV